MTNPPPNPDPGDKAGAVPDEGSKASPVRPAAGEDAVRQPAGFLDRIGMAGLADIEFDGSLPASHPRAAVFE